MNQEVAEQKEFYRNSTAWTNFNV